MAKIEKISKDEKIKDKHKKAQDRFAELSQDGVPQDHAEFTMYEEARITMEALEEFK